MQNNTDKSAVEKRLTEAKVDDDWVAILVQENVLRLQVPVADLSLVHVSQSLEYACHEKLGRALREAAVDVAALDEIEKLATLHELEEHVNTCLVLECVDELAHKGVVELDHDGPLPLRPTGLALVEELPLALYLERVRDFLPEGTHDPDTAEGPRPKEAVELQVVEGVNRLERVVLLLSFAVVVLLPAAAEAMQVLDDAVDVRER